jgi:hypothetical protein
MGRGLRLTFTCHPWGPKAQYHELTKLETSQCRSSTHIRCMFGFWMLFAVTNGFYGCVNSVKQALGLKYRISSLQSFWPIISEIRTVSTFLLFIKYKQQIYIAQRLHACMVYQCSKCSYAYPKCIIIYRCETSKLNVVRYRAVVTFASSTLRVGKGNKYARYQRTLYHA